MDSIVRIFSSFGVWSLITVFQIFISGWAELIDDALYACGKHSEGGTAVLLWDTILM